MVQKSSHKVFAMHELSLAQNIFEIVGEHLPKEAFRQVKSVKLRVGEVAGVVPDSLEFCFNAIAAGTPLQGAVLEVERVPCVMKCNSCGNISSNESGIFLCSFCNGNDLKMISGNELQVTAIELFDEKDVTA